MSYNKYYTRNSGRFMAEHFVSANEVGNQTQSRTFPTPEAPPPPPPIAPPVANQALPMETEITVERSIDSTESSRPPWMNAKLQGVRKITNKERRRRQNENLRRLLTPKSALMVLNEIVPGEQVANQFSVQPVGGNQYYRPSGVQSFCADLTLQGNNYKGYGENKLTARNAAAEQAVRDLILRKMTRTLLPHADADADERADGPARPGADASAAPAEAADNAEETLPMIQLASFALHKLFAEWEFAGHKVPHLRTPHTSVTAPPDMSDSASEAGSPAPRAPKRKVLPENAAVMHPCMLLTYMRPQLEYREIGVEGDRPQNIMFTMGVDVDGTTYTGKATNKKEARKRAARAACAAVFGVQFDAQLDAP